MVFLGETVTTIMMLYKNTKAMVYLPDGDMDFFGIVSEVLQRDTLALFLFIINLAYILQTSIDLIKENGFSLKKKKARNRQYPAETINDTDYTDDLALPSNTPAQIESLLLGWSRQQKTLVWMGTQIIQNSMRFI